MSAQDRFIWQAGDVVVHDTEARSEQRDWATWDAEHQSSWSDAKAMVEEAGKGTPYGTKDPAVHDASTTTDHPQFFYHQSNSENRDSIAENGLQAGRSLGGKNDRVYLAAEQPKPEVRMDTKAQDVYKVDTTDIPMRPDPELPGKWAISEHDITPDRVKLIDTTHPDGMPADDGKEFPPKVHTFQQKLTTTDYATRDWAQWDADHPYVPHPRESSGSLRPALEHEKQAIGSSGIQHVDTDHMDDMVRAAVTAHDPSSPPYGLPEAGAAKAAVAAAIADRMGDTLTAAVNANPLSGPMDEGLVHAGGFTKDADGNARGVAITIGDALNERNIVTVSSFGEASITGIENPILGDRIQEQISRMADGVLRDEDGKVIAALGNTPEAQRLVNESAASNLIQMWAGSSNDSNPKALAMQDAATKEFGLTNTSGWAALSTYRDKSELSDKVDAETAKNGALYQSFLRAQYDNTQAALKAEGVTEMTVYRGGGATDPGSKALMAQATGDHSFADHNLDLQMRPLSSWSTEPNTAVDFAHNEQGTVRNMQHGTMLYNAVVPADRILSTPATGFGALKEQEVVVLGGTERVAAHPVLWPGGN